MKKNKDPQDNVNSGKSLSVTPEENSINQNFWKNFAENIWEKKPLFVKDFPSTLLQMDQSDVFDLLVLYANRCRKKIIQRVLNFISMDLRSAKKKFFRFYRPKKTNHYLAITTV